MPFFTVGRYHMEHSNSDHVVIWIGRLMVEYVHVQEGSVTEEPCHRLVFEV